MTNYPNPQGYADRIVTKAPEWHDLVVFDVLFNNLTTGLFLAAATCELALPAFFQESATIAYPLALVLLLFDLSFLVLDLGDPLRFHHMLRVFKMSSPMSLGTWCLTAYSLFLTAITIVCLIPVLTGWGQHSTALHWLRISLVSGGIPFAFGSAAYKGVLFSTTAQPGWKDARWLGAYLMNSALTLGTAELLLIVAFTAGGSAAVDLARPVECLIGLNLIFFVLLVADAEKVLAFVYASRIRNWAYAGIVVIGTVVPLACLLMSGGPLATVVVLATLVMSHLAVRWVMVHLPHRLIARTH